MPGLSFLSKKSWHTSNIKNVEKVWIAEQKADQERNKLNDLQKQLEEERQIQELRQLQAAHGHSVKSVDTSLDWMYEGPSSSSIQTIQNEEYLLGRVFKQSRVTSEVGKVQNPRGIKEEEKWMEKVSTKTDMFSRMHEDPLLLIKQKEKQQRDQVLMNPIKMSQIRQTIARDLDSCRSLNENDDDMLKINKKHKISKDSHKKDDHNQSSHHNQSSRKRKHEKFDLTESRDDSLGRKSLVNLRTYGLQSGTVEQKDYLGPRPDLVEEREKKHTSGLNQKRRDSSRKLSAEEKIQKLRNMEIAAETKYQNR